MKTLLILIALCGLWSQSKAQLLFSETQYINGKRYIEMVNRKHITITKLRIITKTTDGVVDTAQVKQSVVDSLNKPNAIIVITKDSLLSASNLDNEKTWRWILINDSCSEQIYTDHCYIENGESDIAIDSATLHKNNYKATNPYRKINYLEPGISSLGKPNKREDAFVIVTGRMCDVSGVVRPNDSCRYLDIWNFANGSPWITSDSNGIFTAAMWPACDFRNYDFRFFKNEEVIYSLKIGVNQFDIRPMPVSVKELTSAIRLHLSPNPASATLQASYTLPSELILAQTVLQISNLQGEALQSIALDTAEGLVTISLPVSMSNGTYLCSVVSKGVVYKTVQFMVQR